jgi:pyruvate-ferredoxin/flavodoxin oxidoreductase
MPFVHFFDGFRTSHEVQKIKVIPYDVIPPLVDFDAIKRYILKFLFFYIYLFFLFSFRARALNPEHPQMRGTSESPDIFFQLGFYFFVNIIIFFLLVESANKEYLAIPNIVQQNFDKVAKITGRQYHLFDYVGAPDVSLFLLLHFFFFLVN